MVYPVTVIIDIVLNEAVIVASAGDISNDPQSQNAMAEDAAAAITKKQTLPDIKNIFSLLDGSTTVHQINNKKAEVHEL